MKIRIHQEVNYIKMVSNCEKDKKLRSILYKYPSNEYLSKIAKANKYTQIRLVPKQSLALINLNIVLIHL